MKNPEYKIVIKDISSKITNSREEFLKDNKIRKPFIFKGYTTEADRIKDVVYNNRLLYNLPDYPDTQSDRLNKEKTPNEAIDIKYNFNINIPKIIKTNNSHDDINEIVNNDQKTNNINVIQNKNNDNLANLNIHRRSSLFNFMNNSSYLRKLSETEKNKFKELIKKNLIYQPQMRFKARTDLERVYDNLNFNFLQEKDRHIIEKQLTKIDLYKYKKPKELLKLQKAISNNEDDENKLENKKYKILPNPIIEEKKREMEKKQKQKILYGEKKLYYEPNNNNNKLWARKENLNNDARKILGEYHYKTHFKATEEAQFNIKKNSKSIDNEFKACLMIPNIFNTQSNEFINRKPKKLSKLKNNKTTNKSQINYKMLDKMNDLFNFGDDLYKDDEEKIDYNELENDHFYNNNPLFEKKERIKPNAAYMKSLSEIAFKKSEKSNINEAEENSEDNEEKSDNGFNYRYIYGHNDNTLDNKNIHDTAKLILGECNIYSTKSKFNNSFLKSRAGKTMITKGLSVNEFLKKHGLS